MLRIESYFPLSHSISGVDDRQVVSGIILLPSAGQVSDYKSAALMFDASPKAKSLLDNGTLEKFWRRNFNATTLQAQYAMGHSMP